MLRSHTCGILNKNNLGEKVVLCGWVNSIRDHGGLTFFDIRDRYGITQVVSSPEETDNILYEKVKALRNEWVVMIEGEVAARPEETVNLKIPTGEIEIKIINLSVLNKSNALPFELSESDKTGENLKLKYRYIDIRNARLQNNLRSRALFCHKMREFLLSENFIETETPVLTKSTPEGARDFIVPSRLNPGKFYALPQSPQLFKQLLMVGGLDRYFQIAKCFRDEDLRADRQPEFTQLDVEMSFVEEEDIIGITERLLKHAVEGIFGREVNIPFPRMAYSDAMSKYGSDKPDTRVDIIYKDLSDAIRLTDIKVLNNILDRGGVIKGFTFPMGDKLSLKDIENLDRYIKEEGGGGLGWIRYKGDDIQSPLKKFLAKEAVEMLKPEKEPGNSILFFLGGKEKWVNEKLNRIKEVVLEKIPQLVKPGVFNFLWVTDFPLFEFNEEENRIQAVHHPFTSPAASDIPNLQKAPLAARSRAYDIVLNGNEIGGGSIRIHNRSLQEEIFSLIGLKEEVYRERFGFLLDALEFGAPPHGGIALGLDRLMMLMLGENSIRETIAFPKTQKGTCPLTLAPGEVEKRLLKENRIQVDIPQIE
ncbi:MAG TPA: aspartate--tRNA ligase [bacterium]|nr:aspartate--tRNA ligase [bacterium]